MTAAIGTSAIGGAAGPGSVAASDVSLIPVDPDTSPTMQLGYEFQARNEGPTKKVHTVDDLDQFAPADGGGNRTISVDVRATAIVIPDGEYLDFTPGAGSLEGPLGLGTGTIQGNVAGGLIRGTPTLARVTIVNLGGPDLDISSVGGEAIVMDRVVCAGPVGAGTVTDVTGPLLVNTIALVGGAGLTFTGTIGSTILDQVLVDSPTPSMVGVTIGPGAVVLSDIAVNNSRLPAQDSGQRMIRIDGAATLPTPGVIVRGCTASGGARIFDTSGGGLGPDDLRVIASSLVGDEDSIIEASSKFTDINFPVNVSGLADTWHPIPYIGAGLGLTAGSSQSRFEIVDTDTNLPPTGATPPTRWGLRFKGPRATSLSLPFDVTMLHGGGGSELTEAAMEYDAAGIAGAPVWVVLPDSVRLTQNGNLYSQLSSHVRVGSVPPGARFRTAALVVGAAANIDIAAYTITGGTAQL